MQCPCMRSTFSQPDKCTKLSKLFPLFRLANKNMRDKHVRLSAGSLTVNHEYPLTFLCESLSQSSHWSLLCDFVIVHAFLSCRSPPPLRLRRPVGPVLARIGRPHAVPKRHQGRYRSTRFSGTFILPTLVSLFERELFGLNENGFRF